MSRVVYMTKNGCNELQITNVELVECGDYLDQSKLDSFVHGSKKSGSARLICRVSVPSLKL